ncbi:MAG: DinB family protein [Nocardioidaceae bacterium]
MRTPPERTPAVLEDPGVRVSDPRELLIGTLDWYRERLLGKLDGLSDVQLRTPVEPLGWSPLGLVQHLTWVERRWLRWGFAAEDVPGYPPGDDEAEWHIADTTFTADVVTTYHAEVEHARSVTARAGLLDQAALGGRFPAAADAPSLGRILMHLVQEYARHVGHLDVARELIDGARGE